MWREDLLDGDGKMRRQQRNIRLGTMAELPTQGAAREALPRHIGACHKPKLEMTISELFEGWQKVASLSLKSISYGHYVNALRSYILPRFGSCPITGVERFAVCAFRSASRCRIRFATAG